MNARLFAPLLALALLSGCGGGAEGGQTISLNGSTSLEKVILTLSEQYMLDHPEIKLAYDPTGSGSGIQTAAAGGCDIGLASRPLTEAELALGLTETTAALDGIAVVVNAGNPVENLTQEQLADLFTGEISDWAQVGGHGGPVACVGRESGSGTRDGFEAAAGVENRCVLAQELTAAGAVLEAVGRNPQAVGYASLSAVEGRTDIRAVSIGGVPCTEETVRDGSYPLQRPFLFVTKGELSGGAQDFFNWALSPDAADLIRLAGAIPAES